jgi:hypothetical protein
MFRPIFYLYFLIKVMYFMQYIIVEQILQATRRKNCTHRKYYMNRRNTYVYPWNKFYKLSEQFLQTTEKIVHTNTLYELTEQICIFLEQIV